MPRKPTSGDSMKNKSVRFSDDDLRRVESIRMKMTGGQNITESVMIRTLVQIGCSVMERNQRAEG